MKRNILVLMSIFIILSGAVFGAITKQYFRGATWKPRLHLTSTGKITLLGYPETWGGTPKNLAGYLCSFALKINATDTVYALAPVAGTASAAGYLDFSIPAASTASLTARTYLAEIEWYPADLASEDRGKYQFLVVAGDRVIDSTPTSTVVSDANIASFSGMAGTTITFSGDGSMVFVPYVMPIGDHQGDMGEVTWEAISTTSFRIYNTGNSRRSFTWRVFK